ncbi:MAG: topoisomerase subunit, partial [Proteobacteria bacterium]|nr:topoisomerase subunit [Pseudomonadota bacterium]
MATTTDDTDPFDAIVDAPFDSALSERYLVYALSTITARSLPDLRDGLKPVHRRILWGMRLLRLDPGNAFKKCSRIVGDVMGKYHPHGNLALYDALVRLAQPFMLRYPLVEGQGNFGNIDGDNAAAERYTEARLTKTAIQLMEGLDDGTVNFVPTYNNEEEEPEIFPGLFPNLLANGATGIAVGMATSIPSHNVAEIIDAALELVENPHVEHARLMELFHGPDFATGGLIIDSPEAISAAYETGRGGFRVRGRFHAPESTDEADREAGIERLGGGQYQLVIAEIPYMVPKGKLIEQIAQAIADRKLPILEDVRDESDEQVRIVLVPKSRNVDPELLKESLYKLTDLETRFSLNLNVLDATRTPMVMGLRELLANWVASQIDILQRRTRHRLDKIALRLEIVAGYIIAFLNLDRVIAIIRTEDEPKPLMMKEFGLTDRQAEAILNMRLRSLRKLEEMQLRQEHDELLAEAEELEKLLASPARQRTRLRRDLTNLRKDYAEDTALGRRRTTIAEAAPTVEFSMDAMIEKEPVTVILSAKGWVRAARGHLPLEQDWKFKDGDGPAFALHCQTTDKL